MSSTEWKYTCKIWEKINETKEIKLDFGSINAIEELLADYHQYKVKENELLHLVTKRNWFEKLPLHMKLILHIWVGVWLGLTIAYVW